MRCPQSQQVEPVGERTAQELEDKRDKCQALRIGGIRLAHAAGHHVQLVEIEEVGDDDALKRVKRGEERQVTRGNPLFPVHPARHSPAHSGDSRTVSGSSPSSAPDSTSASGVGIGSGAGQAAGPQCVLHHVLGPLRPGHGLDARDRLLDGIGDPLELDPVVVDDRVGGAGVAVAGQADAAGVEDHGAIRPGG